MGKKKKGLSYETAFRFFAWPLASSQEKNRKKQSEATKPLFSASGIRISTQHQYKFQNKSKRLGGGNEEKLF